MQKPDPEVEKRIETLKEDVRKMLSNAAGKATLEELSTLIDTLQRLGVAYHFEYQISQALQSIYNNYVDNNNINGSDDDDLYTIALRFRLLRQQGYSLSSDVFKKYVDDNGEFKATLANDARALLCLFESSNLRKEGEDILEQLQRLSTRQLKSMLPHLNSSFAEEVNRTLELPLHKRMPRLEGRQYISIYEADAARNDLLLEIAKLDFNSLQKLHRTELCDLSRWEVLAANDLPEYMQVCYFALLDVVKEMEDNLVNEGRSYRVHYAKEAMKALVRAYFVEAIWFNTKYVPTFEEYLEISVMSSGYPMLSVQALVGLEEVATKEAFDWAISVPRILRSSALIARLVDDIHTYKVEEERGDAPSGVQCYMKDHNVSEEEACKKIKEMVDIAWKNINEEIQEPNHPPLPLLLPSLNLARMMEVLYQNGDCYTNSTGKTKKRIASVLVDPIPI
ncbi:hypothetical protein Patl1_04448 [Pistacia atlantica]|uniref:Uncharacterized protein n=1 Tax=Pistacia atlantica TaxID=434234 RepID=A0ACC1BTA5_9ROSI|nr:hypothetical protein Patl1_04448 [Pistacia atlantica]